MGRADIDLDARLKAAKAAVDGSADAEKRARRKKWDALVGAAPFVPDMIAQCQQLIPDGMGKVRLEWIRLADGRTLEDF